MLTFRNPASIDALYKLLIFLYEKFGQTVFDLDNITDVFVYKKFMASYSSTGPEAKNKSYSKEESLNSMKMQAKSYAEIYRLLGWFSSESNSKLTRYKISYIGRLIVESNSPHKLMEQSFLGIISPSEIFCSSNKQCNFKVRIIWCYLYAIKLLNNKATKEELIYICHFIKNQECTDELQSRVKTILALRNQPEHRSNVNKLLKSLSKDDTKDIPSLNTMHNSTRLTLNALSREEFGWCEREYYSFPGQRSDKRVKVYSLSEKGKELIESYNNYIRIDYDYYNNLCSKAKKSLSVVGFVHFLKRAEECSKKLESELEYDLHLDTLHSLGVINSKDQKILFSPLQTLSPDEVLESFNTLHIHKTAVAPKSNFIFLPVTNKTALTSTIYLEYNSNSNINDLVINNDFTMWVKKLLNEGKYESDIIDLIYQKCKDFKKDKFYSLVCDAFNAIGLNCELSRDNQAAIRWDAKILHNGKFIPIEIKSPSEEYTISTKAIRQALENRVVTISREDEAQATSIEVSSYVVGYNLPASRSEINDIIDSAYQQFNIKIALFSLETLILLVLNRLKNINIISNENFCNLKGNVNIKNLILPSLSQETRYIDPF